jgi:hypothetical protein
MKRTAKFAPRPSRRSTIFWLCLLFGQLSSCPVDAAGFLRTQGQNIVDEGGTPIVIRSVGLGNWFLPEGYMWKFGRQGDRPRKIEALVSELIGPRDAERFWSEYRRNYITEADVERIAQLGFNAVRPALNARLFLTEGDDPTYVEENFVLLDQLIGWCKKHGVYVILDMHGAPGGQTGANIDDSANDLPELFTDPKQQQRLVDLWTTIARRYKDEPTVAAYDLLNEPLPEGTGAAAKYKHLLEPLYQRVTAAIREVDRRHMITLEGVNWANDWSVFSAPFDDNVFYQFHYYCWNHPVTLKDVGPYLDHRKRLGAPIWVGETGEKDKALYWATTQYLEANHIGWSFWPWKKMETINTPYSIPAPQEWDAIRAYSEGGPKPSRETAQRAFDQLLQNIRLENCVYFPDVVNAIFLRVPGTIEAENFGPEGLNQSYSVQSPEESAKHYRPSERVPIAMIAENSESKHAEYAIELKSQEWAEYQINSQETRDYVPALRIRTIAAPATLLVTCGDFSQELTVTRRDWTDLKAPAIPLSLGANRLRLLVKDGAIAVDWFKLE